MLSGLTDVTRTIRNACWLYRIRPITTQCFVALSGKSLRGVYSDTYIPWGINRLAYLLGNRLIQILAGNGDVTLRYREGNQPIIATNNYVYLPVVYCMNKTVTFSKETAWDKFTDGEFQYMKYIMDGIEKGQVKLI